MEYDEKKDQLKFSTGKSIYAFNGVIGLSCEDMEHCGTFSYGSDGGFSVRNEEPICKDDITYIEAIELARVMVKRWKSVQTYYESLQRESLP